MKKKSFFLVIGIVLFFFIVFVYSLPVPLLLSPENNSNFTTSNINFSANVSDSESVGIQSVDFILNENINQTNTSGIWDLDYGSNDGVTKNVSTQDDLPLAIFFNSSGTAMYMVSGAGETDVYQYSLSDPWNVSSASYSKTKVLVQNDCPEGLYINPDGNKMYIVGTCNSPVVAEYSLSTPWDISTASYVSNYSRSGRTVTFKPDGTVMYVAIGTYIWYYPLVTPWDLTSISPPGSNGYGPGVCGVTSIYGIFFKPNGKNIYALCDDIGMHTVTKSSLGTAWSISTISSSYEQSYFTGLTGVSEIYIKPDGSKFYISDSSYGLIRQYSLGDNVQGIFNFSQTLSDGVYNWSMNATQSNGTTYSATNGTLYFTIDTTYPSISISKPQPQYYATNESLPLNFTATDTHLSSCWYKVVNSTSDIIINNQSLSSCSNTTFDVPRDDTYTLTLYVNDTFGLESSDNVNFGVTSTAPAISLDAPSDGSYLNNETNYFNFTATSSSLDTCSLYSNFTGSWGINQSISTVYVSSICYQESANTTNQSGIDGNCSLSYDGTYSGTIDSWSQVIDGNYSTSGGSPSNKQGYINYTKPTYSTNTSLWQVKDADGITNLTILSSCWDYDSSVLMFEVTTSIADTVSWKCYNSTGWQTLRTSYTSPTPYEESVWWNMSTPTVLVSGSQSALSKTLSDNYYLWGVECNDSASNVGTSLNNFTTTIDTVKPSLSVNVPTPSEGSQTFSFNATVSDTNLDSCFYSIYNTGGSIDGLNSNVTFTCNSNPQPATVTGYGTYYLIVYADDLATNLDSVNVSFTTSPTAPQGGTGTTIINLGNASWDMTTDVGLKEYDLTGIGGSSRVKTLLFSNNGTVNTTIKLSCENLNGTLCQYVSFSSSQITLKPIQVFATPVEFNILLPSEISAGIYSFNIVGTDENGGEDYITVRYTVGGLTSYLYAKIFTSGTLLGLKLPYLVWGTIFTGLFWFLSFLIVSGLNISKKHPGTTSFVIGIILGVLSILLPLF